jgi:hypothetical protein
VQLFGVPLWFTAHSWLMVCVPVLSISSLFVILADLDWTWVTSDKSLEFSHSIIGVVTISLSTIQILIAFVRPSGEDTNRKRKVFNYFHKATGYATFLLSSLTAQSFSSAVFFNLILVFLSFKKWLH